VESLEERPQVKRAERWIAGVSAVVALAIAIHEALHPTKIVTMQAWEYSLVIGCLAIVTLTGLARE
jgi:hypothetical protein